jgi:hypothetical protein
MQLKRFAFAAVGMSILFGSARLGLADTITLENLYQNPSSGEYQYTVTLDSQTYLKSGDGFVMYNFPDLVTTGPTAPTLSSAATPFNDFAFAYATYSSPPANALTDGNAPSDADTDATFTASEESISPFSTLNVPNITFVYTGPDWYANGSMETATLTLYSEPGFASQSTVYASVDRSGTNPGVTYGFAQGTVDGPSTNVLPEPTGLVILGMGAAGLLIKRRKKA